MSLPSQPTDTSIVTQAFKDFGITTPNSSQISRAITDGIEWVKRDLNNMGHTWKFMMKTTYIITQQGVNTYAVPTDYLKYVLARCGTGTDSGTLQGGSTAVCTLAAADASSQTQIQGKMLIITGGSGVNQGAQIASYNAGTKVVTFDQAISTAVDNTSTYLIIDKWDRMDDQDVMDLRDLTLPNLQGEPYLFVHVPNSIEGRILLNRTPDTVYAIELRYYADLLKEDVTSTLYQTT